MAGTMFRILKTLDTDEAGDHDDGGGYCWKCDGRGYIITCCDDLCHGQDYCMHGDGEVMCPLCKGESGW
jgi:hypothetical protein